MESYRFKVWLICSAPFLILIVILTLSHIKGIVFSVSGFSINDFSEYIKFSFFFIVTSVVIFSKISDPFHLLEKIITFIGVFYAIIFIIYIILGFIDPVSLIDLGLSKGFRFGGLSTNPNAYSAIAALILACNFALYRLRGSFFLLLIIMIIGVSIIWSQSRTGLVFSIVALFLILVFQGKIFNFKNITFIFFALAVTAITFIYSDLNYVTSEKAYNLEENNSFLVRVENSKEDLDKFGEYVGFFGIGPAKEKFDDLDMIGYVIYYIRYGFSGLFIFIFVHFWLVYYPIRVFRRSACLPRADPVGKTFISCLVAASSISFLSSLTNDKWIDPKFLSLWFFIVGVALYYFTCRQSSRI